VKTLKNPSIENAVVHFGIKGMRWGSRKKSSGETAPRGPKQASPTASREDQLVSRAVNQAHVRVVGPAMAKHVINIPKHSQSSDPAVNALLNRTLTQSINRVEEEAGRKFMQGLPR